MSNIVYKATLVPKNLGGFGQDVSTGLTNDQIVIVAGNTITFGALTVGALPSNIDATKIANGAVSNTEFQYLDGTTSAIQTQLDGKQPLDSDLTAIAALATNGLIARTGTGTVATRTITQPAAGVVITNGDGVSGNPTVSLANDLSALEGLSGTGIAVRTGTDAWTNRSVVSGTGTTVTNGDGVSGNIAINITYGSLVNTAVQGNDSRMPPTPSGAGKIIYDNGTAYVAASAGTTSQVLVGGATPAFGSVPAAAIPSTAVTPASYPTTGNISTFTVGADGRLTAAGSTTNGSALTSLNAGNISSGVLAIAQGGTNSATGDLVATNQLTAPLLTTTGGAALNLNSSGTAVNIKIGNSTILQVGSSTIQSSAAVPIVSATDLAADLGTSSTRWNALYAQEVNSGSSATLTHTSNVADGAAAIANKFNNTTALANATAKLATFRSNNVEKAAIMASGAIVAPTIGPNSTNQHTLPALASGTLVVSSNSGTTGQVMTSTGSLAAGAYADPITGTTGSASLSSSTFLLNTTNGTYQDIGLSITLPSAGTYLVTATVKNDINMTTGAGWLTFKLQNSTDTTDIANSERMGANATQTGQWYLHTTIIQEIITVNASKTIKVLGKRDGGTTYSISQVTTGADGRSRISYVKLNYV